MIFLTLTDKQNKDSPFKKYFKNVPTHTPSPNHLSSEKHKSMLPTNIMNHEFRSLCLTKLCREKIGVCSVKIQERIRTRIFKICLIIEQINVSVVCIKTIHSHLISRSHALIYAPTIQGKKISSMSFKRIQNGVYIPIKTVSCLEKKYHVISRNCL